jgi:hypothetical protein
MDVRKNLQLRPGGTFLIQRPLRDDFVVNSTFGAVINYLKKDLLSDDKFSFNVLLLFRDVLKIY